MIRDTSRSTTKPIVAARPKPAAQPTGQGLFGRLFRRRAQPTTFQRCLAVHIHCAEPQRNTYH
jgi:hypothetical protein